MGLSSRHEFYRLAMRDDTAKRCPACGNLDHGGGYPRTECPCGYEYQGPELVSVPLEISAPVEPKQDPVPGPGHVTLWVGFTEREGRRERGIVPPFVEITLKNQTREYEIYTKIRDWKGVRFVPVVYRLGGVVEYVNPEDARYYGPLTASDKVYREFPREAKKALASG